ncbi:hypothetical protein ACIQVK_19380 [Streptomyces sp. NPDC090493]|uniref:hypothetical protein n=1 Tax=Streptomyces sp. NPDC090493 TaxID=3365964 RepID=UPI00380CDB4B
MAATSDVKEWAGTTEDMHDLHRFGTDRRAQCNPKIRTHSSTTDHDVYRQPYMTLRTRAEIEDHWAASMYRFCRGCTTPDGDHER